MVQPTDFSVRSFNYRTQASEGARFGEVGNAAVALDYGNTVAEETAQSRKLGLADCSALSRTGFKGKQAIAWLDKQGLQARSDNNRAHLQENGCVIARLADTEAMVLGPLSGSRQECLMLNETWEAEQPPRCYWVPRQDASAWLVVTGDCASEMFAKICAIDMRLEKFPNGSIAQTSIARINGIVLRQDIGATPAFHIVFDSASSVYLWGCLRDAMAEFDGNPVGHAAILALVRDD